VTHFPACSPACAHSARAWRPLRLDVWPFAPPNGFCPSCFVAPGGVCLPYRSRPTPDGDLSLPCGDDPFSRTASAGSTFLAYRVGVTPFPPTARSAFGLPHPPRSTPWWSGSAPAARCRRMDPTSLSPLQISAPLRGFTPSGSLRSTRFEP
jgi:hypothetical protein